jgi:hypothetical protein
VILNCDPNGVGSYLEMASWVVDWLGKGLGSGARLDLWHIFDGFTLLVC